MSNYKMVDVEKSISIQREQFTRFKTAYDYLNKITFTINGMNIDLLVGDIVSIMGISRVTNLILTRICVSSLLPKRHGGLCKRNLNSNVFILDAGNSTEEIEITENNTNDRLKLRMRERSDDDIHDTTIKKHCSLSMEDLITITGR